MHSIEKTRLSTRVIHKQKQFASSLRFQVAVWARPSLSATVALSELTQFAEFVISLPKPLRCFRRAGQRRLQRWKQRKVDHLRRRFGTKGTDQARPETCVTYHSDIERLFGTEHPERAPNLSPSVWMGSAERPLQTLNNTSLAARLLGMCRLAAALHTTLRFD